MRRSASPSPPAVVGAAVAVNTGAAEGSAAGAGEAPPEVGAADVEEGVGAAVDHKKGSRHSATDKKQNR